MKNLFDPNILNNTYELA